MQNLKQTKLTYGTTAGSQSVDTARQASISV